MKNKLIIFDWGGVILNSLEGKNFLDSIANTIMKFNPSLTRETALTARRNTLYDENGICISEQNQESEIIAWFNRLKKEANLDVDYQTFINSYIEEFRTTDYYKDVIEFLYSLKDKAKVAILSDLLLIEGYIIKEQIDFNKLDYAWLSYDERTSKRYDEIFERIEQQTKLSPDNIMLIDDSTKNIEKAKSHKWHTCQATGQELDKIKESVYNFLSEKENT